MKGLHTDVKSNYVNLTIACFFPGLKKKKCSHKKGLHSGNEELK